MKFFRLILGLLLFGWAAYAILFRAAPRLYDEWTHAAEFAPAQSAKLLDVRCKNWNLFMFNECTAEGVTNSGQKFEISDWRFGRAPSGRVQLLERNTVPPTYSTSVSLATLNDRLYLLACGVILSILFIVGTALYAVRGMRTGNWTPPSRRAA